jgi:hypothetical protein
MDHWMMNNPTSTRLGNYPGSSPFSGDTNLWESFDISVGLDDVFEQPTDDILIEYERLGDRHCVYAARKIPLRDSLTEELYALGIRFNRNRELH